MNFETIQAELIVNRGGTLRYGKLDDVQHVICPMNLLSVGVWVGSEGAVFYSAEALAGTASVWDHKPIVVGGHPKENGFGGPVHVTANKPERLNRFRAGLILNTRYDAKTQKLKAEAWIEPAKLKRIAPQVHDAILNNQSVEISTGLYIDSVHRPGTHNGKFYNLMASNFRPDHVAILPQGEIGAFAVKDGGGLGVLVANGLAIKRNPYFAALHQPDPCPPVPLPRLFRDGLPRTDHPDPDYLPKPKMDFSKK